MRNGKRPFDELTRHSDTDEIDQNSREPTAKGRRTRKFLRTYNEPIPLFDSDDETDPSQPENNQKHHSALPAPTTPPHRDLEIDLQAAQDFRVLDDMESFDPATYIGELDEDNFFFDLEDGHGQLSDDSGAVLEGIQSNLLRSYQPPDEYQIPDARMPLILSEHECLARVLELFPDIAHGHVITLYHESDRVLQQVLDKIMEQPVYPKERDLKAKETQRESTAEAEASKYTQRNQAADVRGRMRKAVMEILKNEFSKIPVYFIERTQYKERFLYASYMALVEAQQKQPVPWGKDTKWRHVRNINFPEFVTTYGDHTAPLEDELNAARRARVKVETIQREVAARAKMEEDNLVRSKAFGDIAECTACFDETPLNRAISCNGQEIHHTCFECAHNYISSEVGESRCKLLCPSGCGSGFTEVQLRLVPDQKLVDKVLKLQQDQDIREAGLDDVIECPFCDNKQVCPDVESDSEFRCEQCKTVSCRKCRLHSHTPDTCEQHATKISKETALDKRHTIEEAMTQALIRNCNKCKKAFIKEAGCNKMTCSSCGNMQCYVCAKSIDHYNHFAPKGTCPLHDDVNERHAKEVKEAEEEARALVEAENPLVSKEGLTFQVSERIKKDEQEREARLHRMGAAGGGGAAGLANFVALYGPNAGDENAVFARVQRMRREQEGLRQEIERRREDLQQEPRQEIEQRRQNVARFLDVPEGLERGVQRINRVHQARQDLLAHRRAADIPAVRLLGEPLPEIVYLNHHGVQPPAPVLAPAPIPAQAQAPAPQLPNVAGQFDFDVNMVGLGHAARDVEMLLRPPIEVDGLLDRVRGLFPPAHYLQEW